MSASISSYTLRAANPPTLPDQAVARMRGVLAVSGYTED